MSFLFVRGSQLAKRIKNSALNIVWNTWLVNLLERDIHILDCLTVLPQSFVDYKSRARKAASASAMRWNRQTLSKAFLTWLNLCTVAAKRRKFTEMSLSYGLGKRRMTNAISVWRNAVRYRLQVAVDVRRAFGVLMKGTLFRAMSAWRAETVKVRIRLQASL